MILLNGSGIRKTFLDELLFENVSFNVDSADKIGFVGANGAGKSTLFKILVDEMDYDEGEIFKNKLTKIGYLEQYACAGDKTIMEEMLTVFDEVISIEEELEDIRFDIENDNGGVDALVKRQTALQERFLELDGTYYKSKIKSALKGLGFNEEEFNLKTDKLSGGQKTRISLAKILLSDTNLLLLDEPTNHLDIDSVEWLEEFLRNYKGAFIVISHDRYFLDKVTNKTFELENMRFSSYNGNYSAYIEQKEIDRKTGERRYEKTMKEIHRLEEVVEQQRRWKHKKNKKTHTLDNTRKVIERLENTLVEPDKAPEEMRFKFRALSEGGNDVLITEGLSMGFGDKRLFKNVDIFIKKGEKVFLLGPNGCGKTTLLKIVLGMLEPTGGSAKIGANIHIGYYDQIQENLNPENIVIDEVYDEYPNMTQTEIRNALAAFLFRGEDVFKEVGKLSGGEKARVELTKLMLKRVNFLIMDEPTNHLDISSREALERALEGYDGTMLMVSHDRYFINKLADRILYLSEDGVTSFSGNYDDFTAKRFTAPVIEKKAAADKSLDYKEQKRLEAQKRKVLNRFAKVEELIAENEEEAAKLEAELEKPEIATDYIKAGELTERIAELKSGIDALMEEWEQLQITIEESGYEI